MWSKENMSTGEVWLTGHWFVIIGPKLDIMCLTGKEKKGQEKEINVFEHLLYSWKLFSSFI